MNVNEQKRLTIARVKCDNSLMFFTRFFFKILRNQKFIINWHHNDLCKALERVSNYEIIFLNINQPPRTSKTELAVNFIAQGISKNPNGNYLYITSSDDLRSEVSVKIRDIITCSEYKSMYGVELKKDQNAKNLWRTIEGGGLKTATIFGQITGFGAGQMVEHDKELEDYIRNFEGCIILDDINKIGDADSRNANNEKANKRIFDTILSRKNTFDTPLINIQQRAGLEDATSCLLDFYDNKPKTKSIVLPIISDGVPMWKWKFPLSEIELIKNNPRTAHTFETQYMQNPQPLEGMAFARSEMKFYKSIPTEINEDGKEIEQGWTFSVADTADEGSDRFAMPIFQVIGNYIYLKDSIFDQENLTVQESQVVEKDKQHHFAKLVVETNSFGAYFKRRIIELIPHLEVYGQNARANKMVRILSYAGIIKLYFLFPENPNPTTEKFMNQVFKLLKTSKKDDDAPDVLAAAAAHLERHYNLFRE